VIQILLRDQVLLCLGNRAHDGFCLLRRKAGRLELVDELAGIEGHGGHGRTLALLSVPGEGLGAGRQARAAPL
jgi:hypothetical protein